MQQPTCADIRIRSTRDAHIIFHAVSLNILPIITRRLDADERAALRSGNVYAWEERGPNTEVTGLGIGGEIHGGETLGPFARPRCKSKTLLTASGLPVTELIQEFLFYYEKSPPDRVRDNNGEEQQQHAWDPLVKQTYSVWVDGPRGRRKWHLTAYFTQATVDHLRTVEDIPHLASLDVPHGKYISTRLGKPRTQIDTTARHPSIIGTDHRRALDVFRPGNMQNQRSYAPFPMPYEASLPHQQNLPHDMHHQNYPQPPGYYNYYNPQYGRTPVVEGQYTVNGSHLDRHPAGYSSSHTFNGPFPRADVDMHAQYAQFRYADHAYSCPPPQASRPTAQLPTPTSPSDHQFTPVYSQYDYAQTAHRPYSSSTSPISYQSELAMADIPSAVPSGHMPFYNRDFRSPTAQISDRTPEISLPSPIDSRLEGSPPLRDHHSVSSTIARRFSPPISDARDEFRGPAGSASPPHSPHSVASSSSVPGGRQVQLAPLRSLIRSQSHPYRREREMFDHSAIKAFSSRKPSE